MSQNWEQDFRVISAQLSDAPPEALAELGGEEAEVAALAASGVDMDEICARLDLKPDEVWALLNEALDRLQGTRWATGPSGDIRPIDAEEIRRPVQGI